MISVLARTSYDNPRAEGRRLIVSLALLAVASIAWYGARGSVVRLLARSSIGCYGREELILAALRQQDSTVPKDARLWGHSLPRPGWLAWASVYEVDHLNDQSTLAKWQLTLADSTLRVRGVIAGDRLYGQPPLDIGGDGAWEVLVEAAPTGLRMTRDITYWAVLRLRARSNELVWLGLVDGSKWAGSRARVKPIWRDGENGTKELAFITVIVTAVPGGGLVFKPPNTVAVFKPEGADGLLRPKLLPGGCGITPWNPPSDAPVRVNPLAELEPVFRQLLPPE